MREPTVNQIDIAELRPTQMTLGFREVEARRREWRSAKAGKRMDMLGRHAVPAVRRAFAPPDHPPCTPGRPGGRLYC